MLVIIFSGLLGFRKFLTAVASAVAFEVRQLLTPPSALRDPELIQKVLAVMAEP
jgi:ABC-type histidine transport system ATPase subunit